ncbi:HCP-like protein, partial [Rhizophagus irregularis]
MEIEFCKPNISDKNIDAIGTKNCLYCNILFTEELWCKECINSLEKLAENGDKVAMLNLANYHKNGKEMEKNLEKAIYWYQKAAEKDVKEAMYNLAICYENGEGEEEDLEEAFYWYQKAAEKDHITAMFNLAL